MHLRQRLCDTKDLQKESRDDFLSLFKEAFGHSLPIDTWEHFYLHMPYGQTVSFTYYDGDTMVAHGGLIPQQLIDDHGRRIGYFLQTAVMVGKKFQNLVVFKSLLDWMDGYVEGKGLFSVAFPNQQSFLPFIKLLRWRNVHEYSIEQFVLDKTNVSMCKNVWQWERYRYCLPEEEEFVSWRSELNNFKIYEQPAFKIVYKEYEGSMEILDVTVKQDGAWIPVSKIMRELGYIRVNIPGCYLGVCELGVLTKQGAVGIPQRMCFYPPEHTHIRYEDIKPSLLLSDVF